MQLAAATGLLLASFALRLHALTALPGFVDEGNHLLWAAEVWQGRIVFPFSTAKPLEIFYLAVLAPFGNPLWAGRLGSVLAGMVTVGGLIALARSGGRPGAGLPAAALYSLLPWTFFHERIAAADPLAAACAVLTAWASSQYVRRPSAGRAAGLAALLIALPLAKLAAAPLMLLPVVVAALYKQFAWRRMIMPYAASAGGLLVLLGLASTRYGVFSEIIGRADAGAFSVWADVIAGNVRDLISWAQVYFGPAAILTAMGALLAVARRDRFGLLALSGALLGGGLLVVAPAASFPRYYLAALAFGCLLAADAILWARGRARAPGLRRLFDAAAGIAVVAPFAVFARQAYSDPSQLDLAEVDRIQHIVGWSSGYGIDLAAQFAAPRAADDRVVYAANLATQVVAWLYWPLQTPGPYLLWDASAPSVIDVVAAGRPAYLIVDTTRDTANFQGLNIAPFELARFERPPGGSPVIVYRLLPQPVK